MTEGESHLLAVCRRKGAIVVGKFSDELWNDDRITSVRHSETLI